MSEETSRSILNRAIQESCRNEEEDGHLVTAWVCVIETVGPNGSRWLARLSCGGSGEDGLPRWTERGLLHHALADWK